MRRKPGDPIPRTISPLRQGLPQRINAFMKRYSLARTGMSLVLGTDESNVSQWLSGRSFPPSLMAGYLDILEACEEAREIRGVYRYRSKRKEYIRGRPRPQQAGSAASSALDPEAFVEGSPDMWHTDSGEF